mmetsp:Transcript_33862/g.107510  ORF Transcript_33862/g.107510 Transcript_33862/m.107510 type:complete len:174 (+) Transcript_33862:3213-3734(+)
MHAAARPHIGSRAFLGAPVAAKRPGPLQAATRTPCAMSLRKGVTLVGAAPMADGRMKISVKVDGKTTTTAWDEACVELAKSVPVSGQKLGKGGKTVAMNKNLVAALVGKKRITQFVVDGLVTEAICDWAADEGFLVPSDLSAEGTVGDIDALRAGFRAGEGLEFEAAFPVQRR